jgi:hypothetical protein
MAVSAVSDNAPAHLDIASAIALAEASGRRNSWAEVTPSSVLLLPYGGSVAAVADLMDVTYDAQVGAVGFGTLQSMNCKLQPCADLLLPSLPAITACLMSCICFKSERGLH